MDGRLLAAAIHYLSRQNGSIYVGDHEGDEIQAVPRTLPDKWIEAVCAIQAVEPVWDRRLDEIISVIANLVRSSA